MNSDRIFQKKNFRNYVEICVFGPFFSRKKHKFRHNYEKNFIFEKSEHCEFIVESKHNIFRTCNFPVIYPVEVDSKFTKYYDFT